MIASLEPPGSSTIDPKIEKVKDIMSGKIKAGEATGARKAKALGSKANGQCLPYARNTTGIEVFGAAKSAPSQAKQAGYQVTKEPVKATGMVITNEHKKYGHAAKYTVLEDGMLLLNEQNYLGRYIVSERTISPSSPVIVAFISI